MKKDLIIFGVSFIVITVFVCKSAIYLAEHDQPMKRGIECHVYECPQ